MQLRNVQDNTTVTLESGTRRCNITRWVGRQASVVGVLDNITMVIGSSQHDYALRMGAKVRIVGNGQHVILYAGLDIGAQVELVNAEGEPAGTITVEKGVQVNKSQLKAARIERK